MSSDHSRVQLLGYFGWGNFGDDLFREVCQENAALLWPGADVRAFAGPRQSFAHPRPDAALRRVWSLARGAAWARTFAHCGGSVFSEIAGAAAWRRRMPHREFEALGVSVGPFASGADRRAVVEDLRGFRRVVVRDRESLDRLDGRAVLGGDLAALSSRLAPRPPAPRAGLVICPSRASGMGAEAAAETIADALGTTDVEVTVLALNAHPRLGDLAMAATIVDRLRADGRRAELVDYGAAGIAGVVEILAAARLVWSQRLHGAIVSYLLGTPAAIVDHHEKCAAFGRDIGLDPRFLAPDFSGLAGTLTGPVADPGTPLVLPWSLPASAYRERAARAYLHRPEPGSQAQALSTPNEPK